MIDVQLLTMRYHTFTALDRVSFQAQNREILGLLGPNGAGKTTIMRILTTYLYPSSGTAVINDFDVKEQAMAIRKNIGYLPETAPLYQEMQVSDYLRFVGESRGLSADTLAKRLCWVREACELKSVWKHWIHELSKGYRQRTGLAQALIHDPKVLILDEPTSGLDPLQIIGIRGLIRELAKEKTIIFSTHILQEVEALADRVVILNNGRVVAAGTLAELTQRSHRQDHILISVNGPREEIERELRSLPAAQDVRFERSQGTAGHRFRITTKERSGVITQVDELIKRHQWPLLELTPETADLEDVFISLLGGTQRTGIPT